MIITENTKLRCISCELLFVASNLIKVYGERFLKTFKNGFPGVGEDRYLPPSYHLHCSCDKNRNKALVFFDGENLCLNEQFAEVVG